MPLTSCLQSQGIMPAGGDVLMEQLSLSSPAAKNSHKNVKANRLLGMQDGYPDVSFIPVAPTDVKGIDKSGTKDVNLLGSTLET